MQSNSSIETAAVAASSRPALIASRALPLLMTGLLFAGTAWLKSSGEPVLFRAFLHYFAYGPTALLYPYLFLFSYVHLIADDHRRHLALSVLGLLITFAAFFSSAPLMFLGAALYALFAIGLAGVIKQEKLSKPFGIAGLSILFVLLLRGFVDGYQPYLQERLDWKTPEVWEYVLIGFVAARVMVSIPLLIQDLPRASRMSFSALSGYFLTPVFLFYFLPISPSEFISAYASDSSGARSTQVTVLRGWMLIGLAVLLKAMSYPFLAGSAEAASFASLAFLDIGFRVMSGLLLTTGFIKICGYRIREPFEGLSQVKTPAELWHSFNVYWREWVVNFAFFPALKVVRNFYAALLWAFFISGVRHGLGYWFLSNQEPQRLVVVLWIFGPWLALLIFLYRRFQRWAAGRPALFEGHPTVALAFRWVVTVCLAAVPAFIQTIFFPALPW